MCICVCLCVFWVVSITRTAYPRLTKKHSTDAKAANRLQTLSHAVYFSLFATSGVSIPFFSPGCKVPSLYLYLVRLHYINPDLSSDALSDRCIHLMEATSQIQSLSASSSFCSRFFTYRTTILLPTPCLSTYLSVAKLWPVHLTVCCQTFACPPTWLWPDLVPVQTNSPLPKPLSAAVNPYL